MPRKKQGKHTTRMDTISEGNLPEPLENLRLRLSSPRLRATGTIKSYLETAERFLKSVDGVVKPTDNDLRRYFLKRRQHGISERTLRKEFFHLKKLCLANPGWLWPFDKEDTPFPEDQVSTVALAISTIEALIAARKNYTERERFYLAVSTTFGCRRIEMSNLEKRHITEDTIDIPKPMMTVFIKTAKHGRPVKHLVPPELQKIFDAYRPRKHEAEALSTIFIRICDKAGVERKSGWGWHSIRRSLVTCLTGLLPKNNLDPAMLADYMGWAKSSLGGLYGGASMVGFYRRPEILDSDPYGLDKLIYGIHPFLPLWRDEKLTKRLPRKTSTPQS